MPTVYRRYAESSSDIFIDSTGRPRGGFTATVWTDRDAGTQLVDLLDEDGTAINYVTSDNDGTYPFQAPDSAPSVLWLEFVGGEKRYAVSAADVGTRLDAVEDAGGGYSGVPDDLSVTDAKVATDAAIAQSKISGLETALAAKATDSGVVHLTGTESVTGVKTFTQPVTVGAATATGHAVRKGTFDALNDLFVMNGYKVYVQLNTDEPVSPPTGALWLRTLIEPA